VCWGVPIRRIGSGCPPQAWLHIVLLEGGGIFSKIFRLVPLPPGLAFCLACGGRLVRIVFIGGCMLVRAACLRVGGALAQALALAGSVAGRFFFSPAVWLGWGGRRLGSAAIVLWFPHSACPNLIGVGGWAAAAQHGLRIAKEV